MFYEFGRGHVAQLKPVSVVTGQNRWKGSLLFPVQLKPPVSLIFSRKSEDDTHMQAFPRGPIASSVCLHFPPFAQREEVRVREVQREV